jgi:hypothetical protein
MFTSWRPRGGVDTSGTWRSSVYYDVDALTRYWRKNLIRLLRASLRNGMLVTDVPSDQIEALLFRQEHRWWSVKLQSLGSKEHFLRYAGRYARRPPMAQRRIIGISKQEITFWAKDRKLRRTVIVRLSPAEFLAAWIQHIPNRYEHGVRSFGLFAPRRISSGAAGCSRSLGKAGGHAPAR